jgi:hypothetical protein
MSNFASLRSLAGLSLLAAFGSAVAIAQNNQDQDQNSRQIKHVFVIAMENHNWTQPAELPGKIQQIYQNPNNPFINSLVNGTAVAWINGQPVNISEHVAYASNYHNVLATQSGNNPHIHPSEPNYIWAEAGTNFGIANDDDPYKDNPPNAQSTTQHLSGLLQSHGKTWKSYQEDIDLETAASGKLTNVPLPQSQWTSPIVSLSGIFDPTSLLNASNDALQYNYAVKHNPMAFFADTNGGNDTSTSNPLRLNYAPLQQLEVDLANNTVANYNWITPNQYNDQHTALTAGFAGVTGDPANLKQGDNALARLVPMIMSSKAYKDGGVIILWWDESEADGESGDNADDFNHTIPEIVISNLAHTNEAGLPYASPVDFTHSSDLRTMQEIFHVKADSKTSPFLGDAANATDLSDLFAPGVIPNQP